MSAKRTIELSLLKGLFVLTAVWCMCAIHETQGFVNNPKIITKDGNLIFESGYNRNITFRLGGTARLNINDELDLLDMLEQMKKGRRRGGDNGEWTPEDEMNIKQLSTELQALRTLVVGRSGLAGRVRTLQNRTRSTTQLMRTYQRRLRQMRQQLDRIDSKLSLDNCKSNPCLNGGTCITLFNGFMCKCNKYFEGVSCERDVNECALYEGTDLGCQNGGQCVNQFGGFTCLCSAGWQGMHCTQRKGDCLQSSNYELCVHGTCVNSNDNFGYKCICEQGWKTNGLTPECSVDVDECAEATTKCATRCINLPGFFQCAPCEAGLTGNGLSCRDIDECQVENGGCSQQPLVRCINTYGSFHCGECPLGWRGDGRTCTRSEDAAGDQSCGSSNICHPAASCVLISNTMVCSCPAGMTGNGIGPQGCVRDNRTRCDQHPCLNGGVCVEQGESFVCACPEGFLQPNCRAPVSAVCTPNPCRNGGLCMPKGTTDYSCRCALGFNGKNCDNRAGRCGGVLVGDTGNLKYPEGSLYEHNSQCAWLIRTNASGVINVTFNAFDLEDSTDCRFDWLQLNDGRTAAAPLIGRFCGTAKPKGGNIITTTNLLYLWFRSDNSTAKAGFELTWNTIPPQCGGIIEVSSHGTIASPGSPGNYPKNRDCVWHLLAPNTKRIKLVFFSMQIETHDGCEEDYVEIMDSIANTQIAKYCNSSHPTPLLLPTSEATIRFHSDAVGTDAGFQIYYSLEELVPGCGGTFTAMEGDIKSPVFISDEQLSCEYDIKLSVGQTIKIEFTKFQLGADECIVLYDISPPNNEHMLQSKICGGYEGLPVVYHSLYNAVHINYFSRGGQFVLHYKTECQFTFESNQDTITSPGYPTLSGTEQLCAYTILTAPDSVIKLEVIDFELQDATADNNNDCADNYLQLNDGLDQRILGPYCGSEQPQSSLVATSNMLVIHYKTSTNSRGRGFKIEYTATPRSSTDCGGIYTKPGQHIRLPTENGQYMHDIQCYWFIMAPPKKTISLSWLSFELEQSIECTYDYVEIYDTLANSDSQKPLGRFCNANLPPTLISHSRILTIKFVSDATDASAGFEATFDFVDPNNYCGEVFSSTGTLNSPNWPMNYTNEFDCSWVMTAAPGTQIELNVLSFDLEPSNNCSKDYLEIRNGGSNASSLIGIYCGQTIPRSFPSFTNQLYVHFHSDNYGNARGFHMQWETFGNGCGGKLNGARGLITSPRYPNSYPNDAVCEWLVRVPQGSSINFLIEDLEMENLFHCNYDSLEIFDGRSVEDRRLTKKCALDEGAPLGVTTSGNIALVRFTSDGSNNERGFRLSYASNCSITLTDIYGAIESPNYGDPYYRDDIRCSWTIEAPLGNQIAVELIHFDNYDGSDNIYFVEPQVNGTNVTQVVKSALSYNTTGNLLTILQNSSVVSFRLEYTMQGCIAVFHKDSGEFTSPGHPKWYPNNIDCLWRIETERGRAIELTITGIDIEESVNCTKDALIISSERDSHNHKERHCGQHTQIVQTSAAHHLFVRFHSDNEHNGMGFKATYRVVDTPCGGIFNSKNGVIQSPNYPLNYPPNSDCEWTIEVTDGHTITLTMDELDMESNFNCEYDYVKAVQDENETEEGHTIFKLCAQDVQTQWTTTSNLVTIRFKSDDSVESKGFKISYKENCGKRIMVDNDHFDIISIARTTPVNETCQWVLVAEDPSKHVLLTILHSQLIPAKELTYPTEADCIEIGGKVFEGESSDGKLRTKFCRQHPPAIISNGRALTVTLNMDIIAEFMADYMILDNYCGGYLIGTAGKFTTPYYPSSYPVNMDCEWNIYASEGNSIVLTFESLDLEDSEDCNSDYVEIRELNERGFLYGVFCGNRVPAPIRGSKSLWIRFHSNNDIVGEGFMASYNNELHNELSGVNGTIESPSYPSKFVAKQPYSWRIEVDKDYVVLLTIKHIVDIDIPYIKFYDGYSEIGALIDYSTTHIVRSNTNVLYFTAERGPFRFEWERLSKEAIQSNRTAEERTKLCGSELFVIDNAIEFNSPGYPHGYAENMQCSWQFIASNPAMHAVLQLRKVDLEEFEGCIADYVRVSSSADLQNWNELDKLCKKSDTVIKTYHGKPYLKLELVTDASINKTGIATTVKTACGAPLNDRHGVVNVTMLRTPLTMFTMDCVWTLQVRQGRRIRISFPESIFTSGDENTNCRSYFLLRNGIAEDSPFLGKGKYCDNNISDVLETSSNHAYIRFHRLGLLDFKASFTYDEVTHQCSQEIQLTDDGYGNSSTFITSPNYPNIPHPHSECVWLIRAPPHHAIAVQFVEQYDLATGTSDGACDQEYVQLNDGASELMPLLGRYCGVRKPNIIHASGNLLRIKYFTDISEPHIGFKAQVALARCGGNYYDNAGVIKTPKTLKLSTNERSVECVYTIEVEQGSTMTIDFETFNLPMHEHCNGTTYIELREIESIDGIDNVTDTRLLCGIEVSRKYMIETNKLSIIYHVLEADIGSSGFIMRYEAVNTQCGATVEGRRGILLTPGYPSGVRKPAHCIWRLRVPKGRRIKLEVLDYDVGVSRAGAVSGNTLNGVGFLVGQPYFGRLIFANDYQLLSPILRVTSNPPAVVYSTDNTMAIDAFILSAGKHRGIKMRFTSDEPSHECMYFFDLERGGTLNFTNTNNSVLYCSYELPVKPNNTLVLRVTKYEKDVRDMPSMHLCFIVSPLRLELHDRLLQPDLLCRNTTLPLMRLPFTTTLKLYANQRNNMRELNLEYTIYRCGGMVLLSTGNTTITQPKMTDFSGRLECAWAVWPTDDDDSDMLDDTQYEVQLETDFKDSCENQYLLLYNGPDQNSPHLARYCGKNTNQTMVIVRGFFFEYYTNNYETQSTFNLTVKEGSGCGGTLTYPYRSIRFHEQYQNNVECIWDLATDSGFHLGLAFEGRFFIESSSGCKRDYLKIQQKNESGEWMDLQTICGRDPPAAINTTTREMRVIFRSDGDTTADGFTAIFQRNCGGILYANNDLKQMSSPGYPLQYDNDLYCNYTIIPADETDGNVMVRFIDFEMEQAPVHRCIFDNVTITLVDHEDKEQRTVLCGRNQLKEFNAAKRISLILATDHTFNAKGFLFEYSTRACGGLVTNTTVIVSPHHNDEDNYPPKSICTWNITAPEGHKILIKFEQLDFENHMLCSYDGVEVYKGLLPIGEQRLAKFCGNLTQHLPPMLSIPQNTALLRSYSDERDASRGFRALISFKPNCDQRIYLDENNGTYNFNQYAGKYENNLDCTFVFKTSADRQLKLEFETFHLEGSGQSDCTSDYLEVFDGAGPFADQIGKYCGHEVPSSVMTSRNSLFVRFVSDDADTSAGFAATIKSVPTLCGQRNLKLEGNNSITIKSPNSSDGKSLKNLNCFWKITADNNIHVKFKKLDIDDSTNCTNDYLKLYDSENSMEVEHGYGSKVIYNGQIAKQDYFNYAQEFIYCGNRTFDAYYSSSKEVFVKYTTGPTNERTGFELIATGVIGCYRNFTGIHGRIMIAESADHCDIYLKSRDNYTLSLYYNDVRFSDYNCDVEYLEVFDGHTNSSLQKICGFIETGKSLFSNTSMLRLRIKLSSFYAQIDITYLGTNMGIGCGGEMYNNAGIFTSPFYPNHVRSNSDCRWIVRVPNNLHVLLRFDEFNLGAKATCHSDYLQIIEQTANGTEVVQRQFCGEDEPKVYKSNKSIVIVRFKKTVNHDGTGWVIRFNGVYSNYQIPRIY